MSGPPVQNRPSDDELSRLYLDEAQSAPEIARGIGCDPTTVRLWLKAAGIELRPRGHNNRFEPGRASAFAGRQHTPGALAKIGAASQERWDSGAMADRKHWLKGAPPEMNPRWLGGVTPERQAFYRSPEWKAACIAVYSRADGYCERCGADSRPVRWTKNAFHIHHIVSFKVAELRAVLANLALLCRDCHLWVHSNANADLVLIAADAEELARMVADGVRYLRLAEGEKRQISLFDLLDAEAEAA